ncbi:unnamed protein product [Owenia fusiformis]|uniref:Uncharacterized protein n=1 Tax=Owenia fusiformis TaxID=6347 RepID=A0A8J1U6I2_OWEFU|nr:unnamed protein product [Owenia fusiformis]
MGNEADPIPHERPPTPTKILRVEESLWTRVIQFIDSVKKAAFVLGTALIVFSALRNSLTWHLQNVWGASGDFWESLWNSVIEAYSGDYFKTFVYGTFLWSNGMFWLFNLFFIFVDLTGMPSTVLKYKIQQDKNVPLDKGMFLKGVKRAIFNQTVVGFPVIFAAYLPFLWKGCSIATQDMPTFQWVVFEVFIFSLVEEVGFYYAHRLFHHPKLYRHIHKVHHEWTAPIGLTSIYAHPLEHVLCNLIPAIAGPYIMGSHVSTLWLWLSLVIGSTTVSHCGYHLPFLPSPEAHDYHHLKFNQNFGVLGVLDRLHGTDALFRASKQYSRHVLLLNTTPLLQQFPDDPKQQKHQD